MRRVLWVAALLLLPLPVLLLADGMVPVVRFVLLAAIVGAYASFVDGTGVAWIMVGLLALHALGYALLIALAARVVAWLLPEATPRAVVAALLVLGFAVALAFPVYHTPFDDEAPRSNWIGLFQ